MAQTRLTLVVQPQPLNAIALPDTANAGTVYELNGDLAEPSNEPPFFDWPWPPPGY
jgi:hypothetical protein